MELLDDQREALMLLLRTKRFLNSIADDGTDVELVNLNFAIAHFLERMNVKELCNNVHHVEGGDDTVAS